jgi:cytochrome c
MKPAAALIALLVALALPCKAQDALALAKGDPVAGATVFKKCSGCHAVGPGAQNKLGPQLNGVIGRVAGSLLDYDYSPAMVEAGKQGLAWTGETLRDFLSNPKQYVPGNKMAFAGVQDSAQIGDLIAFLGTQPPGQ